MCILYLIYNFHFLKIAYVLNYYPVILFVILIKVENGHSVKLNELYSLKLLYIFIKF